MQNPNAIDNNKDELELIWQEGVSHLSKELDPQVFLAFIKPLKFSSYNENSSELVISAPSNLVRKHVDSKFKPIFSKIFAEKYGLKSLSLKFSVNNFSKLDNDDLNRAQNKHVIVKTIPSTPLKTQKHPSFQTQLNPKYTFSSFVVGDNSQFCHAASMQVAEKPGEHYNPLFIYGGVGLGKTHLLHAIGNLVLAKRPNAKVLYMSSESFTNELVKSIRFGKMDEFKNYFRGVDVLLIDDVQFIGGKDRTQEEFFHTFNALYAAKKQIVITSDKLPQELVSIEERLKTRFSCGLTADLTSPDFETRVAILNRKATLDSFNLPKDVSFYIAENISSNVRELEGALTRIHAISSLQNKTINLDLAQTALKPLIQPKMVNLTADDIKKVVSQHFNIKVSEMVSKRRTKNLSFPRHIAMYLCRKHTSCSYPEIGSLFGGRDHSSVIHANNVILNKYKSNDEIKNLITKIENKLYL